MMNVSDFMRVFAQIEIFNLDKIDQTTQEKLAKKIINRLADDATVVINLDNVNDAGRHELMLFLQGIIFGRGQLTTLASTSLLITPTDTTIANADVNAEDAAPTHNIMLDDE